MNEIAANTERPTITAIVITALYLAILLWSQFVSKLPSGWGILAMAAFMAYLGFAWTTGRGLKIYYLVVVAGLLYFAISDIVAGW